MMKQLKFVRSTATRHGANANANAEKKKKKKNNTIRTKRPLCLLFQPHESLRRRVSHIGVTRSYVFRGIASRDGE